MWLFWLVTVHLFFYSELRSNYHGRKMLRGVYQLSISAWNKSQQAGRQAGRLTCWYTGSEEVVTWILLCFARLKEATVLSHSVGQLLILYPFTVAYSQATRREEGIKGVFSVSLAKQKECDVWFFVRIIKQYCLCEKLRTISDSVLIYDDKVNFIRTTDNVPV